MKSLNVANVPHVRQKVLRLFMLIGFILILVVTSVTVLAQEMILYEDPAGRFSVPIPPDWTDEGTDEVGRFVSPDGLLTLSILAIEAPDTASGDQAVLTVIAPDLVGTAPAQSFEVPADNGPWTQSLYVLDDGQLIVPTTQWRDGVTYALVIDVPNEDALVTNQEQAVSIIFGFHLGEQLDMTSVQPLPLTDEMLADLAVFVEEARQRFHVPGVAVAIVQNGAVVYTNGFGATEPNGGQPVTSDTLFMIGSVNKSMTTMMMGTLVDEGLLNWDQPVTELLPSFVLSDPALTAQIRVRDLVNMSSGVPRYDIILSLANLTPQEVIASLAEIPMVAAPGETWNYSNQMVAAGGYLSALAAGAPLDALYEGYVDLVQKRVFEPIGMPDTTFDFDAALANPNHALPYAYNPVTQEHVAVPLESERFAGPIAPAGAVWSNADDMARYLQTELSGGITPDSERVISEATLRTTQSSEVAPAGPYASYGMGWGIDSYNGLPLVLHNGNTIGFSADMAFLPNANLGVLTLTNAADVNEFTASVRHYVFELAFGQEHDVSERLAAAPDPQEAQQPAVPAAVDPETVEPYLGVYEYGVTLEMRSSELWLVGAFVQTQLYPGFESDDYSGVGGFRVRFAEASEELSLEITYPGNPTLSLHKVD